MWSLATPADVVNLYRAILMEIVNVLGVFIVLLMVAGVGSSVMQNMPQFVGERITPQMSRISLAQGWNRLFGIAQAQSACAPQGEAVRSRLLGARALGGGGVIAPLSEGLHNQCVQTGARREGGVREVRGLPAASGAC